jgi:hypothetical protein
MTITMQNHANVRTHNGKGIASFVIGVTCFITLLALVGIAGVMTQGGKATPEFNMIIGLGILSACFVDLIGIGLGFFAAIDRSSRKVFPALGLTLNIGILIFVGALLGIGLSMKTP